MADMNKRGPDCDDCDGEGGERGKRGKRGHRGHDGRDGERGATGPTGPAESDVPTAPFEVKTTTIFANQDGSDVTGDGSEENPFRTFANAIRFVPNIIPPGQNFVVDITNLGVETLPENYQLPVIQGTFNLGQPSPVPFLFDMVLSIRAFPKLVVTTPPTEAVITDADLYTRAEDPDTKLVTITVPGIRTSWAADAMKGRHFISTIASATSCVIYASDDNGGAGPSTLSICNSIGFVPAALGAGNEFQIVEPSATLEAPPATSADGPCIEVANVSSISFQGIRVRCTVPGGSNFGGLLFTKCENPFVELGDFPDGIITYGAANQFAVFSSVVGGSGFSPTGSFSDTFTIRRSLFLNIADWIMNPDAVDCINSVIDGCAEFGNTPFDFVEPPIGSGPYPIQGFAMQRCLITGSTGNGIHAQGGKFSLEFVQINDSAADAINVEKGSNYVTLHHVTGTGNGIAAVNVGVRANDGAQVQATDGSTTITGGSVGDDVQAGSLAIGTWLDAANGLQYDIPDNAVSAQVATGSRIFVRS